MTKKILLMVSSGRQSTEALHFAMHKAKEMKGGLRVIYAVDSATPEDPMQTKKALEGIEKQARTFQVPVETESKTGSYFHLCEEFARKDDVALLVVAEKKDSFLKKVFEESETKKLKDRVACEIKVYPS